MFPLSSIVCREQTLMPHANMKDWTSVLMRDGTLCAHTVGDTFTFAVPS